MAIVKMNKFTLVTFESHKKELLRKLQGFSKVEFINLQDEEKLEKNEVLKQSNKLIKAMEKQQSTIKRQVRRNTRLRNQRRLLLQKVMRDNNLKSVMQTRNFLRNSKNRVLNKKQVPEEQHDFKSL